MISLAEMRVLEDNSSDFGVDKFKLMENAGRGVFERIKNKIKGKTVLVFCGHGNNGGDGFVIARYASKIARVKVLFFGDTTAFKPEAKLNFGRIKRLEILRCPKKIDIKGENLVLIDALLGTGVTGKPREPIKSAIEMFNNLPGYKVAVDTPSAGLTECDVTYTFHDVKEGMKAKNVKNVVLEHASRSPVKDWWSAKRVKVVDIGIPRMAINNVGTGDVKAVSVARKASSHKGDNGKVLVVGGSREYVGAVALAGLAAFRTGVDLVVVAAPEKVGWAVNAISADLIVKKFKGEYFGVKHVKEMLKLSQKFDVVVIGSGISLKSAGFCKEFLRKVKKPCVVDADAVKAVSIKDVNSCVLTPHAKEFEILLKNSGLMKNNFQKHLRNNVVLLKGRVDKIISKNKIKSNKTGNASMTKGGTGDVLAGICGGFIAQSKDLFHSACAAAYINGKIGDELYKKKKYSYLTSEMIGDIKNVVKRAKGKS